MLNHTAKSKPSSLVSWALRLVASGAREGGITSMPDIVMSCNMNADAETVWRAISTKDGVTGWFTGHAEIDDGAGGHHLLTFPEMPAPWDLRVEDSRPTRRLTLSVQAG